jgi:hypothetical protein
VNTFLTALNQGLNLTTTENGAVTNKSSLDAVVDFFGLAGAMRDRPTAAADLFAQAYAEEPLTAVRTMFYLRDVRGGQGERDVFKACLSRLAEIAPEDYASVLEHVPFYGRWDDVLHDGVKYLAKELILQQWNADIDALNAGESVSLLAKWLPSENASSPVTKALGAEMAEALGLLPVEYRQTLSALRARIRLLEQQMSSNDWEFIDYGKLPSQAHRRHTKAFVRHTPERYQEYLASVKKGQQKINVNTVYPYEIWHMVQKGETDYANVAWESLPDYTRGANALVMADTSSSMTWHNHARAMATSVSLALYFAERNTGPFKGYFMSFSSEPKLIKVTGSSLSQRMANITRYTDSANTNLLAAFRVILTAARVAPEETPKVLYVISDMEFDAAVPAVRQYEKRMLARRNSWTGQIETQVVNVPILDPGHSIFETAKAEFAAAGLTLPHVVFWNVEARQNQAPALAHDGHVSLVSGLSPTIFSQVVEGRSPRELVDKVVHGQRYWPIQLQPKIT